MCACLWTRSTRVPGTDTGYWSWCRNWTWNLLLSADSTTMLSIWIVLVACKVSKCTEHSTSCRPGGPWTSMASCSILIHTNISQDNAGGNRASDLWRTYTHQQRVYLMVQLQLCWETHPVLRRRYVAVSERRMLSSRWKSRVELSNGTSSEEAGEAERYIFTITMT